MRHAPVQGLGDRRLKLGGAVALEQAHQRGGDGAEVLATLGGAGEQLAAVGGGLRETIGSTVRARLALAPHQLGDMRWVLHLLVLVVAACMRGQQRGGVQHPHLARAGQHRQRPSDVACRDAVVVAIETHVGRLADADRDALVARKGAIRQGEQLRLLQGKGLAHRHGAILRARAIRRLA